MYIRIKILNMEVHITLGILSRSGPCILLKSYHQNIKNGFIFSPGSNLTTIILIEVYIGIKEGSVSYNLLVVSSLLPVFVNKVILKNSIVVFCCCIVNYHKHSNLKQCKFIVSVFWGFRSTGV